MQSIAVDRPDSRLNRIQWEADGGVRLDLLGFVRFPEAHRGVLHSHPFWELIYIGGGKGLLHIGNGTQSCAAGDILLVRPGEAHQFQADDSQPLDQLYLGFSFDFALPEALDSNPPRTLPSGAFADLIRSELGANLARLQDKAAGHSQDAVRGRLLSVVSRVIGFLIPDNTGLQQANMGHYESLVRKAKEFLRANLKSGMGVPEVARHFCLSPQYFGEIFKRDTGVSVKEFQRHCRMEKARDLLRETGLSVTEVAEEVGLEDLAYFSRLFKRQFGVSPRQARTPALG